MIDANDMKGLATSNTAGQYLSRHSRVWLWFWTNVARSEGGPIFDGAPMIAAFAPHLVFSEIRYASLESDGTLLVNGRPGVAARPVQYCVSLKPAIKAFLMRRLKQKDPAPR